MQKSQGCVLTLVERIPNSKGEKQAGKRGIFPKSGICLAPSTIFRKLQKYFRITRATERRPFPVSFGFLK